MTNKVGIMQGRLSPPFGGRIQAFPVDTWEQEFRSAASIGLDCIEFIFEEPNIERNPLASDRGADDLRRIIEETGCGVHTVCADYFMTQPLFGRSDVDLIAHRATLVNLMRRCDRLSVSGIVVPCVDDSDIASLKEERELVDSLLRVLDAAGNSQVELYLETALSPPRFAEFLRFIDNPRVGINFDSGNSAALGFAPREEIPLLAPWLKHVHIKDRLLHGATVPLGKGGADLPAAFGELAKIHYEGVFIIQAARLGAEMELAKHNADYVRALWKNAADHRSQS